MKHAHLVGLVSCVALAGCSNTVSVGSGGQTSSGSNGSAVATNGSATSGSATSGATSGSTTSGSTTSASSSTGSGGNFGDCNTNADCPPGGKCVEVAPGGFRLCQLPVVEATMCMSPQDQCCSSASCAAPEKCFASPLVPFCAGIAPVPNNVCAGPQCTSSASCANGVCMPAGTFGNKVAACLQAKCTRDSDCTAQGGGHCATVTDPCCHTTVGLFCIYPGNCRSNGDCGMSQYCQVDGSGQPTCHNGFPACPA